MCHRDTKVPLFWSRVYYDCDPMVDGYEHSTAIETTLDSFSLVKYNNYQ